MSKNFCKRIFAALLVICLVAGLLPADVFATQTVVETKATTRAATYAAQIAALATPYNEAYTAPNNSYANLTTGSYYIVNKASSTKGYMLALNEEYTARYYAATDVKISGNSLVDPDLGAAVTFTLGTLNGASTTKRGIIHISEGLFNKVGSTKNETYVEITRNTPNQWGSRVEDGLWVFLSFQSKITGETNGDSWFTLQYRATRDKSDDLYGQDGFAIEYHGTGRDGTGYNNNGGKDFIDVEKMQLYRVYTQGFELYKAIKAAEGYADGNEKGRYPTDLYNTFNAYLKDCLDTYAANNIPTDNEAGLKATMDDMAAQLMSYIDDLSANVTDMNSYIDIPIEILDFRADGLLLEWERGDYGKWNFRSDKDKTGAKPEPTTLGTKGNVYTGLTEPELIKGQMIYTEKMVGYVANFILTNYAYDWSENTKIPGYNSAAYAKMTSLTELGTFAKTIAKTDTKANGGYLKWNQVTTCYDMAYYILNNLWRPVKSDDPEDYMDAAKGLGYNMVVPERKRLRLFKDEETDLYTIDAENRIVYDGYYIYNNSSPSPNDISWADAFFTPIDNLGFESPANKALCGGDTDQGAYLTVYNHQSENTNFHFSMHAEGSFVYYRDQNLYFEFIGDDDVYFYIDGQIAMDLGGSHGALGKGLFLNEIADKYGLEDGGVYSFDMFYIERHTSGSNLKFSTNIKIVETETMTTKGMYLDSSNGASKVDSSTQMGESLADNSLLRAGDTVAYSFDIANSRDVPVYNVSFSDPSLGTSLAYGAVYLCDTSKTGGVNTAIGDIKVFYRTIDGNGTIDSSSPTTKTYTQIESMIGSANNEKRSLPTGSYVVSPGSVTNLKNLLKLGIPRNCQMVVYGFKRLAQESVPSYENTMSSLCYYNLSGTGQTTNGVDEIPIKGTATRTYKVTAAPPTAEKLELVLDYGKAVDIPAETVGKNIKTDSLTKVTGFAGIVTSGSHEQAVTYISAANLKCSSVGATFAGKQGTFTRTEYGISYQPTRFMDTVETVYLAYNIEATNSEYKYVLVELKLLPATSVYYESDFSDTAIETENRSGYLFFDFTNTLFDQERYKDLSYGNTVEGYKVYNYDSDAASWTYNGNVQSGRTYNNDAGTLSTSIGNASTEIPYLQVNELDYDPANGEILVARMKFEGCAPVSGKTASISVKIYSPSKSLLHEITAEVDSATITSGEYFTFSIPVSAVSHLRVIRICGNNVTLADQNVNGTMTLDYLYVGPHENSPLDHIQLNFDGTDTRKWSTKNMTVAENTASGVLKGTIDGSDPFFYTPWGSDQFDYIIQEGDVFKIRAKVDSGVGTGIQVFFGVAGQASWKTDYSTTDSSAVVATGNYKTITVAIPAIAVGENLRALRVDLVSSYKKAGNFEVDWIYVGPDGGDTSRAEPLFFDFNNTPADRERYQSATYGSKYNFDTVARWSGTWLASAVYSQREMDNGSGTLWGIADVPYSRTYCYFETTSSSSSATGSKPLNYDPSKAEIFVVRFKMEKTATNPKVQVAYAKRSDNEVIYEAKYSFKYETAGKYVTVMIPVSNTFRTAGTIGRLRPQFLDIGVGNSVTVDYFYLGTKADYHISMLTRDLWTNSSSEGNEYQDQIEVGPNLVLKPVSDSSTTASGETVLETLGLGDVLSANHTQRNEYYGLTDGKTKYQRGIPSSIVHRGSFRTSSENSYVGIIDALKLGNDNVEIDLQLTSDGVLVLCHDDSVDRTMASNTGKVSKIAWATLRDYKLEVANGSSDSLYYTLTADEAAMLNAIPNYETYYGEKATAGGYHYTARFDALLDLLKQQAPNAMLTLDKVNSQERFVAVYKLLKEKEMLSQAMFSLNTGALENIEAWATAAATACGIEKQEVLDTILVRYSVGLSTGTIDNMEKQLKKGSFLKVVEYTYNETDAEKAEAYLTSTLIPFLKEHRIGFYPSAIGPNWSGGRDDDETTWLHFLNMGADAVMTDRGEEMAAFMHYYNGAVRNSSELIEAEHFQNYNAATAQFYMKEAANVNNNKLVNEMHHGDWLQYNNIKFTGSEKEIYVIAQGHMGSTLKFYVDSMAEANCFAVANISKTETSYNYTISFIRKVTAGTHTVYVRAEGTKNLPLVSFDAFSCSKHTNSNYLFFGFGNTEEDQARYQNNSAYGGYNFDDPSTAYWGTNSTTGDNATSQSRFSIDNTNGVAVINVGTAANGDEPDGTTPLYGPEFMTSNTSGVFPWNGRFANAPLKYTPSKSDFLSVRFKISGCVDTGMNYIVFEFWYTDAFGNNKISYGQAEIQQMKADYPFVQNEYITVTMALPEIYEKAAEINSIGLRFVGVKPANADGTGGKITIDYIYVGPMPDQQTDHLLLDFDEDAEDYSDPVYGGKNYDLESSWNYNSGRSYAPIVADGAISYTVKTSCNAVYHRLWTVPYMRFTPGKDDYIQVRFRAENATAVSGKTPSLHIYTSPDQYSRTDYGLGKSNNCSSSIDLTHSEWQTVNIPLDTATNGAYYRDAEVIGALCIMFNNVAVPTDASKLTTFYIDYVYIGPLENAPDSMHDTGLFFGFTNTEADRARYTQEKYGGYNYDDNSSDYWFSKEQTTSDCQAAATAILDNKTGELVLTQQEGKNAVWTEPTIPTSNGIAYLLKYKPEEAEVYEIRFKMEGFETGDGNPYVDLHLWSRDSTGKNETGPNATNIAINTSYLNSGKYVTLQQSISGIFEGRTEVTNVRFYFCNIKTITGKTGKIIIDYFYVGPADKAPSTKTSKSGPLYFDFTDTPLDRLRYEGDQYGNVYNYDAESQANWATYTTVYVGGTNGKSFTIDNDTGTARVAVSHQLEDNETRYGPKFQTSATYGTYPWNNADRHKFAPLHYVPTGKDYLQIRFRVVNCVTDGDVKFQFDYHIDSPYISLDSNGKNKYNYMQYAGLDKKYTFEDGEWMTMTYSLANVTRFQNAREIQSIGFRFTGIKSRSADNLGYVEIDYIYIGPEEDMPTVEPDDTYGYDSSYVSDSKCSNDGTLFVQGKGVPAVVYQKDQNGQNVVNAAGKPIQVINYESVPQYSRASFTFTGTGFDIISRTGKDQGALRIVVCDQNGYVKKTATVINTGTTELYQIPVASVEMRDETTNELVHGTYTVHIFVNSAYDYGNDGNADVFGGALDRGGEFYFDAVRIYNPINTASNSADAVYAYSVYQAHGEADPVTVELRQKLIDASTESSSTTMEGVVYLDTGDGSTTEIAKYTEVGPNNEVYLAPGKAIAFKIEVSGTIPASIDVGAKSADGSLVTMSVNIGGAKTNTNIATSTALYYPMFISNSKWSSSNGKNYVTVSVTNSGASGILSITDIKYAYNIAAVNSGSKARSLRFLVDRDVLPPVEETPTEDASLTFGAQLYLENDLTMAFRVKSDKLAAYDMSTAYLVVERDVYETGATEAVTQTTILTEYTVSGDRLVFSYPGIAAAQMNDGIRATLYIKDASGKEYVSPVLNTSVATYLDGLLSNSASDTKLVTLILDMVNYGAAAQVYFDRHADAPVNEAFESFSTYADYASGDFTAALEDLSATENAEDKSGKLNIGLDLGTRIGIQYKVTLPADVAAEAVSLVITDANGNELETIEVSTGTVDSKGRYVVSFYGSTSKDMRRVVYATAYANGIAITGTYAYSISTYAWGIQENSSAADTNLVNVTRAMMLYGDSANAYFG